MDDRSGLSEDVLKTGVRVGAGLVLHPKAIIVAVIILLIIFVTCMVQSCALAVAGVAGTEAAVQTTYSAYSMTAAEYQIYAFFKEKGYGDAYFILDSNILVLMCF